MAGGYGAQPRDGYEALARKIADLERRVESLSHAAPLRNSSISGGGNLTVDGGAIVVLDGSGVEIIRMGDLGGGLHGIQIDDDTGVSQIRLGELASGGYGLEQIGTDGTEVPMSNLAYGARAASFSSGSFLTIADTGGAFVAGTGGPTVTGIVVGPSGRMLVSVGALISPDANTEGTIAYQISGAGSVSPSGLFGASFFTLGTTVAAGSVSSTALRTGLTPGTYTLTARYLVHDLSGSGSCGFDNRFIVAQPF